MNDPSGTERKLGREIIRSTLYKHWLDNLLAVIHRDGGHYTAKHGRKKSVEDAMKIASELVVGQDEETTI